MVILLSCQFGTLKRD